jgi:hypothetical protein
VVAVRWVSFGTAVPSWSSVLADARHLPHGRSPGADRHLKIYGDRDNLKREIIRCLKRYVAREVFAALQAPATT